MQERREGWDEACARRGRGALGVEVLCELVGLLPLARPLEVAEVVGLLLDLELELAQRGVHLVLPLQHELELGVERLVRVRARARVRVRVRVSALLGCCEAEREGLEPARRLRGGPPRLLPGSPFQPVHLACERLLEPAHLRQG